MTKLEELESAIASLTPDEYAQLRDWFYEQDWAQWDREIEADSAAGKLDFLLQEAQEGLAKNTLREIGARDERTHDPKATTSAETID